MAQNVLIFQKENKVKFVFSGVDLTAAGDVRVTFAGVSYLSSTGDGVVTVLSATELLFRVDFPPQNGESYPKVDYLQNIGDEGTEIASKALGNIGPIKVDGLTSIIVEDGDNDYSFGRPNTYISPFDYAQYCERRGIPFGNTTTDQETELLAAMRYIAKFERDFQGYRSYKDQPLSFPRKCVYLHGYYIASDVIPQELIDAQCEIASFLNQNNLFDSTPSSDQKIQKKKIADLEITYFEGSGSGNIKPEVGLDLLDALFDDYNCLERT